MTSIVRTAERRCTSRRPPPLARQRTFRATENEAAARQLYGVVGQTPKSPSWSMHFAGPSETDPLLFLFRRARAGNAPEV
jgi:hypothetical protein